MHDRRGTTFSPRPSLAVLALSIAVSALACSTSTSGQPAGPLFTPELIVNYAYAAPESLGDGWTTAPADPTRIDVALLEEGVRAIMRGEYPEIHSILIAHRGDLVFEHYFPGTSQDGELVDFGPYTLHSLQCVTKSLTGIAVGMAIDQGHIPGVETSMLSWYPEYNRPDRLEKEAITLRHLLTNTAGLEWNEWFVSIYSRRNDLNRHYLTPRHYEFLLEKPLVSKPGTQFNYNTAISNLIGDVIARATGQPFNEYISQNLFEPLGIRDVAWSDEHPDVVGSGAGLSLRPRDLLRFGQFVMQAGSWHGRQLVSAGWIEESVTPVSYVPAGDTWYGYLWWRPNNFHPSGIDDNRPWLAGGEGGQWLCIYPDLELIAVTTGGNQFAHDYCADWLRDYLIPALTTDD
jgi:CubicO group peptidase (beta-lactamase class C family)